MLRYSGYGAGEDSFRNYSLTLGGRLRVVNTIRYNPEMKSGTRKLELFCVIAFVSVNLVAPMVVGEMYPFTISPMFSDQPQEYCVYEVLDQNGQLIDSEPFGLHLVYDGNPPGLGMGIQAQPTLHGFGETATLEQLKACLLYKSPSPRDRG